ncbi:hypothetical protein K435DRAFT_745518 [Dendrothele bispora CBS 962.96]|uniref:UspA domain-containing protein n=1 Tax=Dendrothele bispora (strain CBS 962.96) TaxID=1314807 RepID=A0A4S8MQM3_DENBC|nr:hypothetical protein K435DRAFT_745518 [Dendrothele bispora CBS 962.96]
MSRAKQASFSRPGSSSGRSSNNGTGVELTRSLTHDDRNNSLHPDSLSKGSAFGKSLSSMMSSLNLARTNSIASTDEPRGRSIISRPILSRSSSVVTDRTNERSASRARSQSPFSAFRKFRRADREREPSPEQPLPLSHSEADLNSSAPGSPTIRPRNAFTDYGDSGDETETQGDQTTDYETDPEDSDWSGDEVDIFDDVTERNTEQNALVNARTNDPDIDVDPDPLGEGVNVVVPPEPYFPSTLNHSTTVRGKRNPRRRKSTKHHEPLPLHTSRPVFERDRCTINVTQGDPDSKLQDGGRKRKKYVVASDLSEESRYAVEWGIGTVLRDGDEMLIINIVENEARVDPPKPADRTNKLRSQQERQGLAYILVRQATALLQRTRLHVSISCQAWHAKNARHMLLDIIDHIEPTMMIVGSRGLGQLKGILLGSTSHYLIQKCSVPVMVARRRLKRPPRKQAHLTARTTHVSLAEAGIDRVAAKVDEDVKVMRDAVRRDDEERGGEGHHGHGQGSGMGSKMGGNLGKNIGGSGMGGVGGGAKGLSGSVGVGPGGDPLDEGEEDQEEEEGSNEGEGEEDKAESAEAGVKVPGS